LLMNDREEREDGEDTKDMVDAEGTVLEQSCGGRRWDIPIAVEVRVGQVWEGGHLWEGGRLWAVPL